MKKHFDILFIQFKNSYLDIMKSIKKKPVNGEREHLKSSLLQYLKIVTHTYINVLIIYFLNKLFNDPTFLTFLRFLSSKGGH